MIDFKVDDGGYNYPMPRPLTRRMQVPMPVPQIEINQRSKKSMWIPYPSGSQTYDPTKAFRNSRVIYLSDYKIFNCQKRYPFLPFYGKKFKKKL